MTILGEHFCFVFIRHHLVDGKDLFERQRK